MDIDRDPTVNNGDGDTTTIPKTHLKAFIESKKLDIQTLESLLQTDPELALNPSSGRISSILKDQLRIANEMYSGRVYLNNINSQDITSVDGQTGIVRSISLKRQPPLMMINPTEMVKNHRINGGQHHNMPNTRQLPNVPSNLQDPNILHQMVVDGKSKFNTSEESSFDDMPELEPIDIHNNVESNTSEESSFDDMPELEPDDAPEIKSHNMEHGTRDNVNITTTEGLMEAIRLIREESVTPYVPINILDRSVPMITAKNYGNLDDMFIDPETEERYQRINNEWRKRADEFRDWEIVQLRTPISRRFQNPIVQKTNSMRYNPELGIYYSDDDQTTVTHPSNRTTTTTTTNNTQIIPSISGDLNVNTKEVIDNPGDNNIVGRSTNTMATPVRTIPQIPVIQNRQPTVTPNNRQPISAFEELLRAREGVGRGNIELQERVAALPIANIPRAYHPREAAVPKYQQGFRTIPGVNQTPTRALNMVFAKPPEPEFKRPDVNPYLSIPRPVIDTIAQERDVGLVGSDRERAEQLHEYDQVMPEWIESICTKNIENFQVLTGTKIYVFGALNGVQFYGVRGLNNRDLMNYIRCFILLNNPNHPGKEVLPSLVKNLNRNLLEIFGARINIPRDNLKFVSIHDLKQAILEGNAANINNEAITTMANRYNTLKNHKYSQLIQRLYDIDNQDESWVNIARVAPFPMEGIILGLDNYSCKQLVDTFGIAVPLEFAANIDVYIRNNIVDYAAILTRGTLDSIPVEVLLFHHNPEEYISKLTDNEIFSNIGIYVPYNSRSELVRKTSNAITNRQFMYPTIRMKDRSINKETVITETDITDVDTFMICYGTALKYHVYELDELTMAFYRDEITDAMEFRRPEDPQQKFSTSDIEGLSQLLKCFPATEDINDLSACINEGLIDAKEKIAHDDVARTQLARFDKPTQLLIQQFIRQIFYTGMYMRKWNGPGSPFPLKKDTTQGRLDPDAKVMEQLLIGGKLLEDMGTHAKDFCFSLKLCEYNGQGNIEHGTKTFRKEWDEVIAGKQCIRMASSKFIGTSFHYLRSLFRETIPGMNVKAVDRIV